MPAQILTSPEADLQVLALMLQIRSGGTLGFQDLLVTGIPWEARGTDLVEGLPTCDTSNAFPSIVNFPNSTVGPCAASCIRLLVCHICKFQHSIYS